MKKSVVLLTALALGIGVAGCSAAQAADDTEVLAAQAVAVTVSDTESSDDSESLDVLGDYAEGVVEIVLGETITVSDAGASVDGTTVNITAAGVYSISGTLADGQINVDAKGKVYLEFKGVDITSSSGPALNIIDAKKVTLTLVEGTTNYLADAKNAGESDAVLFTNDTLVINGSGELVVTGNNLEGISSDDDLIIDSGTIRVTAADDGLSAHDDITVNDGSVFITAGGDGIDSNGTVNINGGTVVSFGSTAGGDGGLDAIGAFTITGGTLIAGGESVAAPSDDSTQPSVYVTSASVQAAGTIVHIEKDGEEVLTFAAPKEFTNVLFSSGDLTNDTTYDVSIGGSSTVTPVDGFCADGAYAPSEVGTTVSVTAATAPAGAGAPPGGAGAAVPSDATRP